MKKFTAFSFMAFLGCMLAGGQNAGAQTYMEDATLSYPSGPYSSMAPSSVSITWDNQAIELIDPEVDDYGDSFVTTYVRLGEGEKLPVNAYILNSFGNPDDPDDEDVWELDLALYNIDDLWSFDGDEITVYIPQGIVSNNDGALNPEQEIVFHIMPTFTSYTYSPVSGETLDSDYVVKVSFEGNPIEYLQSEVSVMTYIPKYINIPLKFGESVTISEENELLIDLSSLEEGEYEMMVPEGLVLVSADGDKYLSPDIWLEYTLEKSEDSGIANPMENQNTVNVSTINGINVIKNGNGASIDQLPAGLYIINGNKILIRK